MGRKRDGIKIPESAVFPPMPKTFKPVFLVGNSSIKASVTLELNAVFNDRREIENLKQMMKLALWHAVMSPP
jgi:hypothetical protein